MAVAERKEVVADEESQVAGRIKGLYDHSREAMASRHERWRKAYRLLHNRGWSNSRDPWMPSPTASEVYPIISALVGWMTDQRVRFQVVPSADPHSQYANFQQELSADLETLLDSLWVNYNFEAEVEKVLFDALVYGSGFFKCIYDPGIDGGAGNAVMRRCDPFSLYIDPAATSLEDANYIIEARELSLIEFDRRFPGKGPIVESETQGQSNIPSRDAGDSGGRAPMANPGAHSGGTGTVPPVYGRPGQGRARFGEGRHYDGSVVVYEAWIRENTLFTPDEGDDEEDPYNVTEWRCIITTGSHVLMNERAMDMWEHGRHPYIQYVTHDMGDLFGISLVDHLADPQMAINRLLAALQHHAELVSNPIFLEDSRSGIARSKIVNRPGQRITKGAGSEAGWLVPPQMPKDIQQLIQFYINEMERISGLSGVVRGFSPTGRNAQGVIDSVAESAFVRIRLALRNLERTLSEAGSLLANLIVENYSLPRVTSVVGQDGERSMLALRARHFFVPNDEGADPLKFSIYVRAGSAMPISRAARIQEAETLFAMGALDPQAVLEAHDYPNRQMILQRLNSMAQLGIEPKENKGKRNRQR
jgi:hypothetical protein